MKINKDVKLDFDDVLLVPHRTKTASRKNVAIERKFQFYHSTRHWNGTPIVAANMDTTGTFAMGDALIRHNMVTCIHKYYNLEERVEKFTSYPIEGVWYSLGIKHSEFEELCRFVESTGTVPNICIDVANGYTENFVEFCAKVRDNFNDTPIIMAGNVCTPEMVQELILHGGVDIVKIGIGPGSACTTRLKTGVGYPQFSAIIECSHAAHGLKSEERRMGLVCADGGCRTAADVCKAFAANADFVMLGGMLAGTDECEGEWQYEGWISSPCGMRIQKGNSSKPNQKKSLKFYGMSSKKAQDKHGEGLRDYRSSEGRVFEVLYKGSVDGIIQDLLGGIRSCCAYIGATSLKDMAKCAEFIQVNRTHFDQST